MKPVLRREEILVLQKAVVSCPMDALAAQYATNVARATRPGPDHPASLKGFVQWGAGPRAGQAIVLASKARAMIAGRHSATADDVRAVLPAVLRHRIVPSYLAIAEGVTLDEIVKRACVSVTAPDGWTPVVAGPVRKPFLQRILGR